MNDEAVLEELRERFTYGTNEWAAIRAEGAKDMRFIAGDAWDPDDRREREEAGRPCLSLDELSQYVNQLVNSVRQNKRGIKVTPEGDGANDQTAAFRQGLMRQIEYRSNATQAAYVTLFENAAQRGYGFLRIKARYVGRKSFEQELVLDPLPNPDLVTMDPDSIRTDGADWGWGFIHESRTEDEFRREFPDAEVRSFNVEHMRMAPQWWNGKRLQIAEYWTIVTTRRQLLRLKPPPPSADDPQPEPINVFVDELQMMPSSEQILMSRWVEDPSVRQYLTNGFELLKGRDAQQNYTTWPGTSIPIVPCYGKVIYVDRGSGAVREILSLIRLARDPQMLYCYYRTCEAELVGMTPKFPYFAYEGQLDVAQEELIAKSLHEPVAVIKVKATVNGMQPGTVLPHPQRQPYEPPIQALEVGAEAARRAIQAAIGSSPLPTSAQRRNEKSGVALEHITRETQQGSFHFVDHYDEALTRTGAILDELIPSYYDTARDVPIRKPDDTLASQRINDPRAQPHIDPKVGRHDVTISTGPSFDSDRDAAADFADTLAQSPAFPQIADLVIKLRNLGPIGDEIAERLTPPQYRKPANGQQPLPPAAQQAMAAAQQQIQELSQHLQQAVEEIKTEKAKQEATLAKAKLDADTQLRLQAMRNAALIAVAKINALTKGVVAAQEAHDEAVALAEQQAHEAEQAAMDRTHDLNLADQHHAQALAQTDQQTAAAAGLADQGQAHALEQMASQPAPEASA